MREKISLKKLKDYPVNVGDIFEFHFRIMGLLGRLKEKMGIISTAEKAKMIEDKVKQIASGFPYLDILEKKVIGNDLLLTVRIKYKPITLGALGVIPVIAVYGIVAGLSAIGIGYGLKLGLKEVYKVTREVKPIAGIILVGIALLTLTPIFKRR